MIWSDGGKYNGQWKCDNIHGNGMFEFPNGNVYRGNLKDGMAHGYGNMAYKEGSKY